MAMPSESRIFALASGLAAGASSPLETRSFAQAGRSIPVLGTTHADHFYGEIPCTRSMMRHEIEDDYERETGRLIVETFSRTDPSAVPGVLVCAHGPFTWGADPIEAAKNAVVLEEVAFMGWHVVAIRSDLEPIERPLLDRHFRSKHGEDA